MLKWCTFQKTHLSEVQNHIFSCFWWSQTNNRICFLPQSISFIHLFIRETCTINPFLSLSLLWPSWFYSSLLKISRYISIPFPTMLVFSCLSPKWPETFLQSSPSLQVIRIDFKNEVILKGRNFHYVILLLKLGNGTPLMSKRSITSFGQSQGSFQSDPHLSSQSHLHYYPQVTFGSCLYPYCLHASVHL